MPTHRGPRWVAMISTLVASAILRGPGLNSSGKRICSPPMHQTSNRPDYIPSPSVIAIQCAAIRDTWSDVERARRLVGRPKLATPNAWQPPMIDTTHFETGLRRAISDHAH